MKKVTIVLNNIRSAWNVGAIMRTCDAVNFDLILVGYTPRPIGKTLALIAKTAIGAEKTVEYQTFENYIEVFNRFKSNLNSEIIHLGIELDQTSQNVYTYIEQLEKDTNLASSINKKHYFLWFGNEIHGLEADLLHRMDRNIFLPMLGSKEGLNISNCMTAISYLFLRLFYQPT
jgi:23S rRNA (guanosine2251-2'-O)-methyltransferase